MRNLGFFAAAALGVALSGAALADDLKPIQSQSIDLGSVGGDAYYTVQPDGYHVVATFAQRDEGASPVRFEAVLAPGQAVVFSTPRAAGEQPVSFSIRRQAEHVVIARAPLTN